MTKREKVNLKKEVFEAKQTMAVFKPELCAENCLFRQQYILWHNFKNLYNSGGFEPGSSVLQAATMTTAPRRQEYCLYDLS
jgi:hypothetical protein